MKYCTVGSSSMVLSFTVSNRFLWSIPRINITNTVVPILGFHVSMVRGALARISDCKNGEFLLIFGSSVSSNRLLWSVDIESSFTYAFVTKTSVRRFLHVIFFLSLYFDSLGLNFCPNKGSFGTNFI